ncbi:MAG: hypothetical protein C4341_05405 [Armatimonadota bacterium]
MLLALMAAAAANPTVTHQANAVRAGDLVRSLSDQSGISLAVSPALESEPVITEFRDRPLDEVLDALALVVAANGKNAKASVLSFDPHLSALA